MGNFHESASFIHKGKGCTSHKNVIENRRDTLYVKASKDILVQGVGLCSAIYGTPIAVVGITELATNKNLVRQEFKLKADSENQYYEFTNSIEFKKNKNYMIEVHVFGPPTYTYIETSELSTHRDVIISVCKENPLSSTRSTNCSQDPMSSIGSLDSMISLMKAKSNSSTKSSQTPSGFSTKQKFSFSEGVISQEEKKKQIRRGSAMVKLSKKQEVEIIMNLISGIQFKKPLEIGCCSTK